jgi:hypothetical protein
MLFPFFPISVFIYYLLLLALLESRIAFFTLLWTCELSRVIGWSKGRDACPSTVHHLHFSPAFQRLLSACFAEGNRTSECKSQCYFIS